MYLAKLRIKETQHIQYCSYLTVIWGSSMWYAHDKQRALRDSRLSQEHPKVAVTPQLSPTRHGQNVPFLGCSCLAAFAAPVAQPQGEKQQRKAEHHNQRWSWCGRGCASCSQLPLLLSGSSNSFTATRQRVPKDPWHQGWEHHICALERHDQRNACLPAQVRTLLWELLSFPHYLPPCQES